MKILGKTATRASFASDGAFSYGVYSFIYLYTSALCSGSPHSSHSVTVNGNDGSRIDVNASTKGTSASTPAKHSGAIFATAPINRPPAGAAIGHRASRRRQTGTLQRTHGINEILKRMLLIEQMPLLIPGTTHLTAAANVRHRIKSTPRSSMLMRDTENPGSELISYAPYPVTNIAESHAGTSLRHTKETGMRSPSRAVTTPCAPCIRAVQIHQAPWHASTGDPRRSPDRYHAVQPGRV